MIEVKKGLKHYNEVYKNRENAKISDLAEARVFFDSIGGEFKDKSKGLTKQLEKYTKGDLFAEISKEEEELVFGADTTYLFKEVSKEVVEINADALVGMKDMEGMPSEYFKEVTTTVIDKELVIEHYKAKTLPTPMRTHVNIYKQTALGFQKKRSKKITEKKVK
jgi:hypothetical protein